METPLNKNNDLNEQFYYPPPNNEMKLNYIPSEQEDYYSDQTITNINNNNKHKNICKRSPQIIKTDVNTFRIDLVFQCIYVYILV